MPASSRSRPTTASARRAVLHHLLDRFLDARPDLEDQIHRYLRKGVDAAGDPHTVLTLKLLTAAKQMGDVMGALRGKS